MTWSAIPTLRPTAVPDSTRAARERALQIDAANLERLWVFGTAEQRSLVASQLVALATTGGDPWRAFALVTELASRISLLPTAIATLANAFVTASEFTNAPTGEPATTPPVPSPAPSFSDPDQRHSALTDSAKGGGQHPATNPPQEPVARPGDVATRRESPPPGHLLPCPFCGGKGWLPAADAPVTVLWCVDCLGCATCGPDAPTRDEAIAAWNRRAAPPSPPPAECGPLWIERAEAGR